MIEWAALVLGTAMASVLAFLLTEARCGTARLAATPVSSSGYCHALGAPGLPSRLGSVMLVVALFVAPAAVALACAVLARARLGLLLRRCALGACGGVATSYALVLLAHSTSIAD